MGTAAGTGRKSSTAAPEEPRGRSQRGRAWLRDARGRRRSAASPRIGADPGMPRWRPGSSSCLTALSRKTGSDGEVGTASRSASVRTRGARPRFQAPSGAARGCSGPERCVSPSVRGRKAPSRRHSPRWGRAAMGCVPPAPTPPFPLGLSGGLRSAGRSECVAGSSARGSSRCRLRSPARRGSPHGYPSPPPGGLRCDVVPGTLSPFPSLWVPPCASALPWGEGCGVAVGSSTCRPHTSRGSPWGLRSAGAVGAPRDVPSSGGYGEKLSPPILQGRGWGSQNHLVPKSEPPSLPAPVTLPSLLAPPAPKPPRHITVPSPCVGGAGIPRS